QGPATGWLRGGGRDDGAPERAPGVPALPPGTRQSLSVVVSALPSDRRGGSRRARRVRPLAGTPNLYLKLGSSNVSRIGLTRSAGKRFRNSVAPANRLESASLSDITRTITTQVRRSSLPNAGC